jgi:hypothetical protein
MSQTLLEYPVVALVAEKQRLLASLKAAHTDKKVILVS